MKFLSQICLLLWVLKISAIPEPYPELNGGSFSGPDVPESPDPLVKYRWDSNVNQTQLQIYRLKPKIVTTDSPSSFLNLNSILTENPNVTVVGIGSIRVDFGQENAAWLELQSNDLASSIGANGILMSISEYNQPGVYNSGPPYPDKTATPKQYDNIFRLELNSELYEGVRFGWIHVLKTGNPWAITNLTIVCQVKPTNYLGSFQSSNTMLTRVWWTGAYSVHLNLLSTTFGAILMDRGDRIAWCGDAHTSQKAALIAFGNFDFIKQNIDSTSGPNGYNGIESYALYWILSLVDYYRYTSNDQAILQYTTEADGKLQHAQKVYESNDIPDQYPLSFFGSDDRVGADFEYPSCPEAQAAYRMLVIRTLQDWANVLDACASCNHDLSANYKAVASNYIKNLRSNPNWYKSYGMHAAGEAINAGFPTVAEATDMFNTLFSDPIQICSFSPFNNYFILHAIGLMIKQGIVSNTFATDHIQKCWGGQIELSATCFWECYSPEWNNLIQPTDPIPNGQTGYTSMCHPWGAGVTHWITDNILGVRPLQPGYKTFLFNPILSLNKDRHWLVSGSVPTPFGIIEAYFEANYLFDDQALIPDLPVIGQATLTVLPETVGIFLIPMSDTLNISGLYVDKQFYQEKLVRDLDSGLITLQFSIAGEHFIRWDYDHPTKDVPQQPQPPASGAYPATFIGQDNVTQGSWINTYGKDGYILFNFQQSGTNVMKLPKYISSIGVPNIAQGIPRSIQWAVNTTDNRALLAPSDYDECGIANENTNLTLSAPNGVFSAVKFASFGTPQGQCGGFSISTCSAANSTAVVSQLCLGKSTCTIPANDQTFGDPCVNVVKRLVVQLSTTQSNTPPPSRSLGAYATIDPNACQQTFPIDIFFESQVSANYIVSLYFVDYDNEGRRLVVETRDPVSSNILAPTQIIESSNVQMKGAGAPMDGGVYLRYQYNNSIRFRIDQVRGGDAVLSAIFFDPVQ